jgi:hypothetical protein
MPWPGPTPRARGAETPFSRFGCIGIAVARGLRGRAACQAGWPDDPPCHLALQGGGAHGAFTWGVLDALLEDGRFRFDGHVRHQRPVP